jgi:hypothetical protein
MIIKACKSKMPIYNLAVVGPSAPCLGVVQHLNYFLAQMYHYICIKIFQALIISFFDELCSPRWTLTRDRIIILFCFFLILIRFASNRGLTRK